MCEWRRVPASQGFDPAKTTEDDLRELFSGIGIIARIRQKQGFPDQWPFAVKIYKDERGNNKDEAIVTYDDPMAGWVHVELCFDA